jgi:hypothetical protein
MNVCLDTSNVPVAAGAAVVSGVAGAGSVAAKYEPEFRNASAQADLNRAVMREFQ